MFCKLGDLIDNELTVDCELTSTKVGVGIIQAEPREVARSFASRSGNTLIDSIGGRNATILYPVSEFFYNTIYKTSNLFNEVDSFSLKFTWTPTQPGTILTQKKGTGDAGFILRANQIGNDFYITWENDAGEIYSSIPTSVPYGQTSLIRIDKTGSNLTFFVDNFVRDSYTITGFSSIGNGDFILGRDGRFDSFYGFFSDFTFESTTHNVDCPFPACLYAATYDGSIIYELTPSPFDWYDIRFTYKSFGTRKMLETQGATMLSNGVCVPNLPNGDSYVPGTIINPSTFLNTCPLLVDFGTGQDFAYAYYDKSDGSIWNIQNLDPDYQTDISTQWDIRELNQTYIDNANWAEYLGSSLIQITDNQYELIALQI